MDHPVLATIIVAAFTEKLNLTWATFNNNSNYVKKKKNINWKLHLFVIGIFFLLRKKQDINQRQGHLERNLEMKCAAFNGFLQRLVIYCMTASVKF